MAAEYPSPGAAPHAPRARRAFSASVVSLIAGLAGSAQAQTTSVWNGPTSAGCSTGNSSTGVTPGAGSSRAVKPAVFHVQTSRSASDSSAMASQLGDVAMAFRDVESAGRPVSLLGDALRVVFETLAIIGANVAFVFRTIGQDFGASMAMIHAGINGSLQGAWTRMMEIRQMRLADAREARTEVDALNGYIARRGAQLNIPTPVNSTLWALLKLLEEK